MATIKEIAEKCNVSMATVSRTLNYDETLSISADKRARILEVADELNYVTPRNRKNRKKNPSRNVGLVLWNTPAEELEDPYYMSMRLGIERYATEKNLTIKRIFNDNGKYDIESFMGLDGIIAVGKFKQHELDLIQSSCRNVVFVDSIPVNFSGDSIIIDFVSSMISVLDYLTVEKSYQKVGFIGGKEYLDKHSVFAGEIRGNVITQYLKDKDIYEESNFYYGNYSSKSGYDLVKEALDDDHLPEVFICSNDSIAIGALRAIHEAGLRVPNDIALVGFNDIPTAQFTFPPLTTVKVHIEFMGATAIECLMEQFEGRQIYKKIVVPTELIIRETT